MSKYTPIRYSILATLKAVVGSYFQLPKTLKAKPIPVIAVSNKARALRVRRRIR